MATRDESARQPPECEEVCRLASRRGVSRLSRDVSAELGTARQATNFESQSRAVSITLLQGRLKAKLVEVQKRRGKKGLVLAMTVAQRRDERIEED